MPGAARARTRSRWPSRAAAVLGIDASPRAIGKAIDKARERGLARRRVPGGGRVRAGRARPDVRRRRWTAACSTCSTITSGRCTRRAWPAWSAPAAAAPALLQRPAASGLGSPARHRAGAARHVRRRVAGPRGRARHLRDQPRRARGVGLACVHRPGLTSRARVSASMVSACPDPHGRHCARRVGAHPWRWH